MDAFNNIQAKDLLTASSPLLKAFVDGLIIPKLTAFKKKLTLGYQTGLVLTAEHFQEYLHRTYGRAEIVNTIAFANSQRRLKDIYLPLTIVNKHNKNETVKINAYPKDLMKQYRKVLITDVAGMGKSTITKRIFLDIVEKRTGIPILIELRRLTKENGLLAEIHSQLNAINKEFDHQLLLELIQDGEFIFILDGYDEISLSDRKSVTENIQRFISQTSNNKFVLTSRPDNSLYSFGDFQEFSILGLKKSEAFNLLEKYDFGGETSQLLVLKLEEDDATEKYIKDFLTNPLLVTLLFTAYDFKRTIPFKKHDFYRQVFDALFDRHDSIKEGFVHEKQSRLGSDDFHRILRYIGFSFMKNQMVEFNKDLILKLISESKRFYSIEVVESNFLQDLITSVPLFLQDGNAYRWAHKSLQEYFAAKFIECDSKTEQENILLNIYNHHSFDSFSNILELYSDIDPQTFRNVVVYRHLKNYEKFCNHQIQELSGSTGQTEIDLRNELCFSNRSFFCVIHERADGESRNEIHKKMQEVHQGSNKSGLFLKSECVVYENVTYQIYIYKKQQIFITDLLFKQKNIAVKALEWKEYKDWLHWNISHKLPKLVTFEEILSQPEKLFNKGEAFTITNALIFSVIGHLPVIDYENALKLIKEIEVERGRDQSSLVNF